MYESSRQVPVALLMQRRMQYLSLIFGMFLTLD